MVCDGEGTQGWVGGESVRTMEKENSPASTSMCIASPSNTLYTHTHTISVK